MTVLPLADNEAKWESGSTAGGGCLAPLFQRTGCSWLVTLAGFINRQQQDLIGYLQEENLEGCTSCTLCATCPFGNEFLKVCQSCN